MTSILRPLLILFCMLSLPACATISKGTTERVRFETVPPGVTVTTDIETTASKAARRKDKSLEPEYFSCSPTPCEIKLSRRTNTIATLTYPGMEPLEFAITSGLSRRNLAPSATGGAVTGLSLAGVGAGVGASLGATSLGFAAVAGPAAIVAVGVGGSFMLVDAASGAAMQLSPNPLVITMVPKGTEVVPDPEVQKLRDSRARKQTTPKTAKEICARAPGYNTPNQRSYCADWNRKNKADVSAD
ncbi:hypothetical protein [Fretibacter rubidus]|uniref:hypothetical protein n=1 Tax=Fretibacter rubidus TaxID=570162 RepID=UPI00352BCD71